MKINILVATNDRFILPTRVMLASLLETQKEEIQFDVYVLYEKLKKESLQQLYQMESERMKIIMLRVPGQLFQDVPVYNYFSKEVYYRLVAHTILPDSLERIMWIDGDIILCGEIKEFYNQDMSKEILIACEDMLNGESKEIHKKLQIPDSYIYFSSGVMLYNLKVMREKVQLNVIFQFIQENKEKIQIVDQDVLNAMFYKEVKVLRKGFVYNYFAADLRPISYKMKLKRIKILHFCGEKKPWKKNYPYYGFKEFWVYANKMEEYQKVYKEIYKSCQEAHRKWVISRMIKDIIRFLIPDAVIDKIRGIQ